MYVQLLVRAHANGSIRRGHKNDATETITMRTGLGVNLKEVKIFNRVREKGQHSYIMNTSYVIPLLFFQHLSNLS